MNEEMKLELKQVFDASIEKVWDAWTDPQQLVKWQHSPSGDSRTASVDLKEGGEWRIVMVDKNHGEGEEGEYHDIPAGGKYIEIDKPNKLVFSWLWEGQNPETHTTTMTILLKKLEENKTELTLIQTGFPDQNMVNEHTHGWTEILSLLEEYLTT